MAYRDITAVDLMLVEQKVAREAPSLGVAYAFWFFLGWFSAHRFYLGKPGSAALQIASWLVLVQPIWWLVDAFLIPGYVRRKQDAVRTQCLSLLRTIPPELALAVPAAPSGGGALR